MLLIEFQNVFPMINSDVWTDWDMFKQFLTPLGCEDRFFIATFVNIICQNEQV